MVSQHGLGHDDAEGTGEHEPEDAGQETQDDADPGQGHAVQYVHTTGVAQRVGQRVEGHALVRLVIVLRVEHGQPEHPKQSCTDAQ